MSDRYGYIGIETLLDFCDNSKDHAVTPNDFMRMARVRVPERKPGKWIHGKELSREMISDCVIAIFYEGWKCSECDCLIEEEREPLYKYCPHCGAKMEGCEQE